MASPTKQPTGSKQDYGLDVWQPRAREKVRFAIIKKSYIEWTRWKEMPSRINGKNHWTS